MTLGCSLTVGDVVARPLFQKACVVAGKSGLTRRVRWAHILEVCDFETLLHGEEMILSTGIGLYGNTSDKISFVQRLIESGVSCLCIELGHYFDTITEELIELADQNDFPIIVFKETVRFVDITQDLHTFIINQQHSMLTTLENISREFTRLTLTSQGIPKILKILHESTNAQVIFFPNQGKGQAHPFLRIEEQLRLKEMIVQQIMKEKGLERKDRPLQVKRGTATFLIQPVGALGQTWAHLVLIIEHKEPEEFELLVLDRAALSLAQDLLRNRYMEERTLHSQNVWVDNLINRRLQDEEEIRKLSGLHSKKNTPLRCRVCLIEMTHRVDQETPDDEREANRLYHALLVRSTFEKFGFHPAISSSENYIVVVAIDVSVKKPEKERWHAIIQTLHLKSTDEHDGDIGFSIGIGGSYSKLADAYQSYQDAKFVLRARDIMGKVASVFYEDMGILRLLLPLENSEVMASFVDDYLGPIIEYDRSKGSNLLWTLKVYLDNEGSKKDSAQELLIVRQTLYYRLEKIKELIGEDFMSSEKRLSIEVALRAYQLLHPEASFHAETD